MQSIGRGTRGSLERIHHAGIPMSEEAENCPMCDTPWDADQACPHLFAFAETSWPDGSGEGTPLDLTGVAWDSATELFVDLSSLFDSWIAKERRPPASWPDRLMSLAEAIGDAAIDDEGELIRDADSDRDAFRRYLGALKPVQGMAETHCVLDKMPGLSESYTAFWSGQAEEDARDCTELLREDLTSIRKELNETSQ